MNQISTDASLAGDDEKTTQSDPGLHGYSPGRVLPLSDVSGRRGAGDARNGVLISAFSGIEKILHITSERKLDLRLKAFQVQISLSKLSYSALVMGTSSR